MKNLKFIIPLFIFLVLVAFLGIGLTLKPREIPSALINKPAPHFELAQLANDNAMISPQSMKGQIWLMNVWASWCAACVQEHPLVTELAQNSGIEVVGLNYKDDNESAQQWLDQYGNPYSKVAVDDSGRAGIDWGVYGVPESFLVDQDGNIRYKQIGPFNRDSLAQMYQLIDTLKANLASTTEPISN